MSLIAVVLLQIDWKTTVDDAVAEAKSSKRPILWYVHTVKGTAMDRKDVVDDYAKAGPWMMPDVVDLVRRRFVPLRMAASGELAKSCGIARLEFIEPGLVVLTDELKMVHKLDRWSTFQEDWVVDLLRGVLAKCGAPEPSCDDALRTAKSPLERARVLRRMRKPAEALAALKDEAGDDAAVERGWIALREGKWEEAHGHFAKVSRPDALYLAGAALHNLNRDVEGTELWKRVDPGSAWGPKAAAELAGRGPFVRCFEELAWLPEAATDLPTSSTRPRTAKEINLVTRRSVALLLRTQRANGSWNDSNYEFGGKDSLPNVYMAGTAIACTALLAWKDVDPKGVQAALDRAWPYLNAEKNMAVDDADEVIWGYAYRISYFARLAAADAARKDACLAKMKELVAAVAKLQKRTGIWRHEYDAPFTTATVLHALWEAKQAGVDVPDAAVDKALDALASCRTDKGVFSYGYPPRGATAVQGSAGRMPLCELALFLSRRSKQADLHAAVEKSFELHALIEKVRKYDDHADRHANGGFFFWYDMAGRAEAIGRLQSDRDAFLAKQRELVLSIAEIDACFVDSHELGKTYGTAMGLITLKLCEAKK